MGGGANRKGGWFIKKIGSEPFDNTFVLHDFFKWTQNLLSYNTEFLI